MKQTYLKLIASILVAIYSFYYLSSVDSWHFIDNINLIIHEAGHFIFLIFGQFIQMAGGSLLQLIMPALFALSFFRTKQNFSGAIMLYWLAINFFSVAHYAGDAVNMNIPLLGGDSVIHDWNYLLSALHLLDQTQTVANIIYLAGILSIGAGLFFTYKAFKDSENKIVLH